MSLAISSQAKVSSLPPFVCDPAADPEAEAEVVAAAARAETPAPASGATYAAGAPAESAAQASAAHTPVGDAANAVGDDVKRLGPKLEKLARDLGVAAPAFAAVGKDVFNQVNGLKDLLEGANHLKEAYETAETGIGPVAFGALGATEVLSGWHELREGRANLPADAASLQPHLERLLQDVEALRPELEKLARDANHFGAAVLHQAVRG